MRFEDRSLGARALRGFFLGLLITAGIFLTALLRALLAMLAGRVVHGPQPHDYLGLGFYTSGIVAGTVFLAVLWPLLKPGFARHAGFALAGVTFVLLTALGGEKSRAMLGDPVGWLFFILAGAVIGVIVSHLLTKHVLTRRGLTRS